jgi:hypothetical protein
MAEPAHHPPLNYEASRTSTHLQTSSSLPPEVVTCLYNARFVLSTPIDPTLSIPFLTKVTPKQLHLATITNPTADSPALPHVSLMNYTFLQPGPNSPHSPDNCPLPPHPTIIMTTNPQSLKTHNLLSNPQVSLLVHDWVSHRPPTVAGSHQPASSPRSGSPPATATRSSLASLLLNMNTSALSSISTTITGQAVFLEKGSFEGPSGQQHFWRSGNGGSRVVWRSAADPQRTGRQWQQQLLHQRRRRPGRDCQSPGRQDSGLERRRQGLAGR